MGDGVNAVFTLDRLLPAEKAEYIHHVLRIVVEERFAHVTLPGGYLVRTGAS